MANFEPKIMGFCCSWAADSGIKSAEITETQYIPNLCFLPATYSGIIAPETILETVTSDVDGVFMADCSYYSEAYPRHCEGF